MMLALTLWRPWDQCMLHGPKRIENRPWEPPLRVLGTTIALHAGQKWDEPALAMMRERGFVPKLGEAEAPAQAVVGTARVARVMRKGDLFDTSAPHGESLLEDPWFFGPYGWVLDDLTPLTTPVPCRGMQKLWTLPSHIEERVRLDVQSRARKGA